MLARMSDPDSTANPPTTSALPFDAHALTRLRRFVVLHAASSEAVGRIHILENGLHELGRTSPIVRGLGLGDTGISRQHARVVVSAASVTIEDLSSRHGTWVNGSRARVETLETGSIVRIGETVLLFEEHTLEATQTHLGESSLLRGPSVAMHRVRGLIQAAAHHAVPVLVLGESGVGKELVATEVHRRSDRAGAFVPVNCGALPAELAEAELFGHAEGAFTGAKKARKGLFASAEGGTIFLDEIGELPPALQPKLLRVLADGEIRRVGSDRVEHVDVRVVAATNRPLRQQVDDGTFRGDLYSRLACWIIDVPPLRERREDILSIGRRFPNVNARWSADAAEALVLHPWEFNVRELRQVLSAASIRGEGEEQIGLSQLGPDVGAQIRARRTQAPGQVDDVPLGLRVPSSEPPTREALIEVLKHHGGNVSRVAEFFGKERAQVYRWLRREGLEAGDYRAEDL
jgi:transcriptional regulator with GAF, ATPase, and Fis domain